MRGISGSKFEAWKTFKKRRLGRLWHNCNRSEKVIWLCPACNRLSLSNSDKDLNTSGLSDSAFLSSFQLESSRISSDLGDLFGVNDVDIMEAVGFVGKVCADATPLMLAVMREDLLSCLLNEEVGKEQVFDTTRENATVVHYAAMNKVHGEEIIRYLVASWQVNLSCKDRNGEQPVHYAARVGNFKVAEYLLEAQNSKDNILQFLVKENNLAMAKEVHEYNPMLIHCVDPDGRSLLHLAAIFSDVEMCRWLLKNKNGFEPSRTEIGDNLLHSAAMNRKQDVGADLIWFLKLENFPSLDPNEYNKEGKTPLHLALMYGKIESANALISIGADLSKDSYLQFCLDKNVPKSASFVISRDSSQVEKVDSLGRNALHRAAESKELNDCKILVKAGVDPKAVTKSGETAMHFAASNKKFGCEMINYFRSLGLDVDAKTKSGETPLHVSLMSENFIFAQALLCDHRANFRVMIGEDNIFHYCVRNNKLLSVKFVRKMDPDLLSQRTKGWKTPLHLAAQHADLKMCSFLIKERGADVRALNGRDMEGVMHFAARNKECEDNLVEFLFNEGADLDARNSFLETPLVVALKEQNVRVAENLINLGADTTIHIQGENLMFLCVRLNNLASVKLLHKRNKNLIKRLGERGETILHYAAEQSNLEMCQWLVSNGADFRALSERDGSSVLHFAAYNRDGYRIVRYFYTKVNRDPLVQFISFKMGRD
ncbi:putative ankyrin repeat protein RF_0381 [Cloeon dipterum]|uniref:putative ankyrin repeat protein RF_0381 n=1 Tax=Cloeon dipterum TaxID=197152 RepID=UPI0032207791